MPDLIYNLLFCVVIFFLSTLLVKYKKIALIISCIVPLAYLLGEPTNTWFGEWKRWAISIPVIYYAYLAYFYDKNASRSGPIKTLHNQVLSIIIVSNVLLLVPAEMLYGGIYNTINSVMLCILAIMTPRNWLYQKNNRLLGFEDALWVGIYTSTLALFFISNPIASQVMPIAVAFLFIPMIACILEKSCQSWFAYRAYSLNFLLLGRALLPEWVLIEPLSYKIPNFVFVSWTLVNCILVSAALKQKYSGRIFFQTEQHSVHRK